LHQWERRLKDLAHLLGTCAETYFEPDLFRMNINQFLQTSRTVTFIIQKHKSEIRDFDNWYSTNIEGPWRADRLMSWAKDSRNKIEKQGDLDLHSSLRTTLFFSYLQEQDITIECGREELVNANVKRLIRLAQRKLPTGVADAAAVKIERRWVATSLPDTELLRALSYVYEQAHKSCVLLAVHVGGLIDSSIPSPKRFAQIREEARRVRYVKLRGLATMSIETEKTKMTEDFVPPQNFMSIILDAKDREELPNSLSEAVQHYGKLAKVSFEHYATHVPIAFVFDSNWRLIDMLSTSFSDTTDKYIFWRTVADRIDAKEAYAIVWIAESWLRNASGGESTAIRNLPIIGERLHVVGFDKTGAIDQVAWTITRPYEDGPPTLVENPEEDSYDMASMPFFFVPAMRALGVPHRPFTKSPNAA
jgi:hypothetical protein